MPTAAAYPLLLSAWLPLFDVGTLEACRLPSGATSLAKGFVLLPYMSGTPFGKLAAAKAEYVVSIVTRSVMPQAAMERRL